MACQNVLFLFVVVSSVTFNIVSSLQCFECSSFMDENCGKTWGYADDGGEGDKYLKTCTGENVACRKIEYEHHNGFMVTRSCWNATVKGEISIPELECNEMRDGYVCYCTGDEPCNGKELLQPYIIILLFALLPLSISL